MKLLMALLLLLIGGKTIAQKSPVRYGIGVHSSLSYTGLNPGVAFHLKKNRMTAFLGARISANDLRDRPARSPGLFAGFQWREAMESSGLDFIVAADYGITFYNHEVGPIDLIQDYILAVGARWNISDVWALNGLAGLGFYHKYDYMESFMGRNSFTDLNGLLRIYVVYYLN